MRVKKDNKLNQILTICEFFTSERELLYAFPQAGYPLNFEQLVELLDKRSDFTTIVDGSDQILGFACLYDIQENNDCYLGNVIINPSARRKGIGQLLVSEIMELAKEKYHVKSIKLNCWQENLSGIKFYQKLGFNIIDTFEVELNGESIVVCKLQKD